MRVGLNWAYGPCAISSNELPVAAFHLDLGTLKRRGNYESLIPRPADCGRRPSRSKSRMAIRFLQKQYPSIHGNQEVHPMSEQPEAAIEQRAIKRRFIACTQSTGRVGKSTVAEGLIAWLGYAGIQFAAIDADSQHQTLFHRYPDDVGMFDATKTFDDFASMIQTLPASPVILVDFPAQATDFLLSAAQHFRLLEFFDQSSVRPTLLIFAADDPTAKGSASNTVRFFGDSADYLLVENPARFKSAEFGRTALGNWLKERNTPTLHIPTVTAVTMNAWEALEDKLKRYLSLDEVCRQKDLHELSRYELQFLRNRFLVQFEDFAGHLLPDTSLIKNRVARCRETTHQKIDRFNDPLLATL
jgi:hypothetical protein